MSAPPLILLIEGSAIQAKQIMPHLQQHGFQVEVHNDGPGGLQAVQTQHPALVVLEVNLPGGMDGFQVCRRLKSDPGTQDIPVIILTVADGSEATMAGLEAGADDYIPKDEFAVENLVASLRDLGLIKNG